MKYKDKPDWRQWIPIYGIYKSIKDDSNGKPSLCDSTIKKRFCLGLVYHGAVSIYPILKGIEKIISNL